MTDTTLKSPVTLPATAASQRTVTAPSAAPAVKKTAVVKTRKTVKAAKTPAVKTAVPAAKPAVKPAVAATKKVLAKPVIAPKAAKTKKPKMVRDSMTMPKAEYAVLDELKLRAAKLDSPVKKTELLRAGIKALAAMSDAGFRVALKAVPSLKIGRPSKL